MTILSTAINPTNCRVCGEQSAEATMVVAASRWSTQGSGRFADDKVSVDTSELLDFVFNFGRAVQDLRMRLMSPCRTEWPHRCAED